MNIKALLLHVGLITCSSDYLFFSKPYFQQISQYPSGTLRRKDVLLWSSFDRDVPDHNRTKLGRFRFLTYFDFAMPGMYLASGNIEKFS